MLSILKFCYDSNQAWQIDFHQGKFDLRLLVRADKLQEILKLYTAVLPKQFTAIQLQTIAEQKQTEVKLRS